MWPQFRADARNTAANTDATGPTTAPGAEWDVGGGASRQSGRSVAVADGTVYAALSNLDGPDQTTVLAVDPESGETEWRYEDLPETWTVPAVADGTVYVADGDGTLHAFDAGDGDRLWTVEHTPGPPMVRGAIPTLVGDTAYVVSRVVSEDPYSFTSGVAAIDTDDEELAWKETIRGAALADAVAVADGTVYATQSPTLDESDADDVAIYAFDADTGDREWDATVNDRSERRPAVEPCPPVVGDGEAYAFHPDDDTTWAVAFSTDDGSERWRVELPGSVRGGPALAHDTLYVGTDVYSEATVLAAVDVADRSVRWTRRHPEIGRALPAVAGETVYFGPAPHTSGDGWVAAYDRTGDRQWATTFDVDVERGGPSPIRGPMARVPAVADGRLYVSLIDHTFALAGDEETTDGTSE